jgi:hypothetical protein
MSDTNEPTPHHTEWVGFPIEACSICGHAWDKYHRCPPPPVYVATGGDEG